MSVNLLTRNFLVWKLKPKRQRRRKNCKKVVAFKRLLLQSVVSAASKPAVCCSTFAAAACNLCAKIWPTKLNFMKKKRLKYIYQASFDHVKVGPTPFLALHSFRLVEKWSKLSIKLLREKLFLEFKLSWGKFWPLHTLWRHLLLFLDFFRVENQKKNVYRKLFGKYGLRNLQKELAKDCERFHGFLLLLADPGKARGSHSFPAPPRPNG